MTSSPAKIDPVTAVQDSIDALALSLFEALRGVRDVTAAAVASSSSGGGGDGAAGGTDRLIPMSAFQDVDGRILRGEEEDVHGSTDNKSNSNSNINKSDLKTNAETITRMMIAQAKEKLLEGLNMDYFPIRAYDMLHPDYESFLLSYLGGEDDFAKELVERFDSTLSKTTATWTGDKVIKEEKTIEIENTNNITLIEPTTAASHNDRIEQQNQLTTTENEKGGDDQKKIQTKMLGEVGYEFRKEFDTGWYTGKVVEIRSLAGKRLQHGKCSYLALSSSLLSFPTLFGLLTWPENGYDRRCVYSDGDIEDLRLEDLEQLAKLDPNNNIRGFSINNENDRNKKPRLSIKLNVSKNKPPSKGPPRQKAVDDHDSGDMDATANDNAPSTFPKSREEYVKLLLDAERLRDSEISSQLASNVLSKSQAVNDLVANLPGMERTRSMQLQRIHELIEENRLVMSELKEAYDTAKVRNESVREALGDCTALALGLDT